MNSCAPSLRESVLAKARAKAICWACCVLRAVAITQASYSTLPAAA